MCYQGSTATTGTVGGEVAQGAITGSTEMRPVFWMPVTASGKNGAAWHLEQVPLNRYSGNWSWHGATHNILDDGILLMISNF